MNEHQVDMIFAPGVYIRKLTMPANYIGVKEVHDYTHVSVCLSGVGELIKEGKFGPGLELLEEGQTISFKAGDILTVDAGVAHAILTYAPTVWLCIHGDK